ncbi:MAG: DUF1499 domain-containing protein [Pseudomonadales bacterium]
MPEQQTQGTALSALTWWSKAIFFGAVIAALLLPIGAIGARLGIWSFGVGFLMLAAAAVLAVIGVVTGIAAIIAAHRRNLSRDKQPVYLGTMISLLVLAFVGMQFYAASTVPPIHDITTDVSDPPQFDQVVALRGDRSNPLEYDAQRVAPLQQQAYPWLRPLSTELPPDQALERAVVVLDDMGLEIVNVDPSAGRVEATATTFWFGFKDDVVVRVRAADGGGVDGGSVVDVRSVSRVGVSDVGANARRIDRFVEKFQ